jgi:hypothetical protein
MTQTPNDNAPKEYWILTGQGILPIMVMRTKEEADRCISMTKRSNEPDSIHVIEYCAYRELEAKLQKAVAELKDISRCELGQLNEEASSQWAEDIASEALEKLKGKP